jgi:hypothetical protein
MIKQEAFLFRLHKDMEVAFSYRPQASNTCSIGVAFVMCYCIPLLVSNTRFKTFCEGIRNVEFYCVMRNGKLVIMELLSNTVKCVA